MESTDFSRLFGSIFERMDSSPSLFLEYRAPLAASNSGVSAGRVAFLDASLGQIPTWVTFMEPLCEVWTRNQFLAFPSSESGMQISADMIYSSCRANRFKKS